MKSLWKRLAIVALAASASTAFAGSLYLEIGNPEANPEAKKLHALVVARVTACHEPAKSVVTASAVRRIGGKVERTPLVVKPLSEPGVFAITGGEAAPDTVIDIAVRNPQYENYQPRTLVKVSPEGVQWAGIRRYFSTPPTEADVRAMLP